MTETVLTLIFHAHVPLSLLVEAFSIAMFLINRLPSPNLGGKTPYELLLGKQPVYSMLRTFGCLCFPYLRDYAPHKLSPKSTPCVFLDYSTLHKGFRCLDRNTHRVYISRHVQFRETCFPYASTNRQCTPNSNSYTQFCDNPDCGFPLSSCFSDSLPSPSTSDLTCLPCSDTIPEPSPSDQTEIDILAPDPVPIDCPSSPPFVLPLSISAPIPTGHPMLTRGKAGIFKPKAYHALTVEPSSWFFQALLILHKP